MVDDDDAPIPKSRKQVIRCRQHAVEKMKSHLENIGAYVDSTADTDQTGDYGGGRPGKKRSFADFVAAELVDSEQPKKSVLRLLSELDKYQEILGRT